MKINMSNKTTGATMKSPIIVVLLLCGVLTCASAQQAQESIAVDFKGVTVAFHADPHQADAKLLPLVDVISGAREHFGLCLGGTDVSGKIVEILGKDAAVLKSISIEELLTGKGKGIVLSQSKGSSQARWFEKRYAVDLPSGKVQLVLKALASGDASADRHLIVTFALESETATTLALRVLLPVSGSLESVGKGFLAASRNGSAAAAFSVYPTSATVVSSKSLVTLTSGPVSLEPARETAALWMVIDGVSGSGSGSAKQAASRLLKDKRFGENDPRIVVVSTTDTPTTQPGEIVTYNVVCRNIGTAEAADVTLSNPVSQGMQYVEGSATAEGSSVSFDANPAGGTVRNINWKFKAPIKPGEERLVSFKVRVQ